MTLSSLDLHDPDQAFHVSPFSKEFIRAFIPPTVRVDLTSALTGTSSIVLTSLLYDQ